MSWTHPTGRLPRTVNVVALGESCQAYMRHQLAKGRSVDSAPEEVWTVNRGIGLFHSDMAFVLDELNAEMRLDPAYAAQLRKYNNPIISTSYAASVQSCYVYPGAEILDCIRKTTGITDPYWHNSMPMVVAYAWLIGVERLTIWGADYTLASGQVIEADRANLEYWVGWVRALGMQVGVPVESTLLNQRTTGGKLRVYGLLDQSTAPAFLGLTS